ncbi:hypothetical protein DYH09_10650 [bacterium CPR1]|nr:hypothetical protein [bacterium CPR1]
MDDFNAKLDRIQRELEALQRRVKAQNTLHLQSLAEQREAITSAFGTMQHAFERAFEDMRATMTIGFGQVHTALWRRELLLKDLTVQTESRFGIVGDVLDLTRNQHALMEQRWSDLDERVRRLQERDPPAA